MESFALVTRNDDVSIRVATKIKDELIEGGMVYSDTNPQIIITVGGDGTFLSAIHKYRNQLDDIIFTGVHTGTLGFFVDYTLNQLNECIDDVLHKEPEIECKSMLKIHLESIDRDYYAVNEMSIQSHKTKAIEVLLDDVKIETFHGSGLVLSTQAGSTALNRALGGAVIHPSLEVMQLCEMAGIHHNRYKSLTNPLIISREMEIKFISNDFTETKLCFDRYSFDLPTEETIVCGLSDKKVRLAHYHQFHWNKHLEQLF